MKIATWNINSNPFKSDKEAIAWLTKFAYDEGIEVVALQDAFGIASRAYLQYKGPYLSGIGFTLPHNNKSAISYDSFYEFENQIGLDILLQRGALVINYDNICIANVSMNTENKKSINVQKEQINELEHILSEFSYYVIVGDLNIEQNNPNFRLLRTLGYTPPAMLHNKDKVLLHHLDYARATSVKDSLKYSPNLLWTIEI